MPEFTSAITFCLWLVCTFIALLGCKYAIFAGVLLRNFGRQPPVPLPRPTPVPVTLLKPLHGAEPGLAANIESFFAQDYPSEVQMVCGVQDPADAAVGVVDALVEKHPDKDIRLLVSAKRHGENPKISNVINIFSHAKHDILVLSDSDIGVPRSYVCEIVALLQKPGVGLVTCLYRGRSAGGFWARLAAAAVDHHFLPSVLVGLKLGLARPCFGSTIALKAETLHRIGGFEAFSNTLADDYEMGQAVRRLGLKVAIPSFAVDHTFYESTLSELAAHELRWARTIRLVDPVGYAGSIVTHPLPFALAGVGLSGASTASLIVLGLTIACRLFVATQARRLASGDGLQIWLSPLRDLLSFAIFVASFLAGSVSWRGRSYAVDRDGSIKNISEKF